MNGRRPRPTPSLPLAASGCAGFVVALLGLAALADAWRCAVGVGVEGATTRTVLLVTAGAAAAALSVITALGVVRRQGWAAWVAGFIGLASAPQAAATGFRPPYGGPDTATVLVGLLLLVTALATAPGVLDGAPAGDDCATRGRAFEFGAARLLRRDAAEGERDHRRDAGGHDGQHRK